MRRQMIIAVGFAGLLGLGACGSLGERSTVAELRDRCDSRGGVLLPRGSAAEEGMRCERATANAAANSANAGAARATAQMNSAIDRSLR